MMALVAIPVTSNMCHSRQNEKNERDGIVTTHECELYRYENKMTHH